MRKPDTKAAPGASVTVKYDLFDLPTAQHKAGLAGLLLQIESMKARVDAAGEVLKRATQRLHDAWEDEAQAARDARILK